MFTPMAQVMFLPQGAEVMLLLAVAVMRCVPLSTREAHITCEAYITPWGHITFRGSGTHR